MQPARSLLVAFAVVVTLAGCKHDDAKAGAKSATGGASDAAAPAVLTVAVQAAAMEPMAERLEMTGSVAAWDPLPVMPAANGLRIMKVTAEEGDEVHAGQLLAQLDNATLLAQLAAARARSASAEAQLAKMRSPNRRQDLLTAEAGVSQAEANVASAKDSYMRFKELQSEGGVSAADLVARQTALNAAVAAADQAKQHLSLTREGSRNEDIRIAEAAAAEARANVQQLESEVEQTEVTAPAAGQIIKRDAHLGDVSSVGRALFQLVRDSRLEVDASMPEGDLGKVSVGDPVDVTSDARPDVHAVGKVRLLGAAVDQTSRQGMIKIDLPVHSGFEVGMFVRAQARTGTHPALVVPAASILTRETGSQVFVLDGTTARAQNVVTGARSGGKVAIASGLKPGEQVVVAGVGFLKDGDHVDVAPALSTAPVGDGNATAGAHP